MAIDHQQNAIATIMSSRNMPAASVDEQQLSTWLELTRAAIEQLDPQYAVVQAFWKQGIRSDGRIFAQATPLTVQHSTVNTDAAGSATVRAGKDSLVWATVTLQVGQPSAVAPKQGDVVVSVVSLCGSSTSSPSCSSTNVPRLQSFLQRIAEENVDLEQLVIQEGRLAYRLAVTVTLLAEASRCITTDASVAAVTAALLDTRLPVQPVIQNGVVYFPSNLAECESRRLNMPILPCSLTAAGVKMSRSATTTDEDEKNEEFRWIVHPSAEEESSVLSVCTVVIDAATASVGPASSSFSVLCLDLQTPFTPLAAADVAHLLQMAADHAADMKSIIRPSSK